MTNSGAASTSDSVISIRGVSMSYGARRVLDGVTDPHELFSAGARGYLEGAWERRDLSLLFNAGDGPPGFELMRRQRVREWISQNDTLLKLSDYTTAETIAAARHLLETVYDQPIMIKPLRAAKTRPPARL